MEWLRGKILQEIVGLSNQKPVLVFKHSTRCSISRAALDRIERNWKPEDDQKAVCVYVHVIEERKLSNEVAAYFAVTHESPQVLLIKNGKCVYHASHGDVRYEEVMENF
ncbi:MAG: bacillithiol system redox-active protein YtxJ [Flavobacteriales bacterium]